ncbi:MAG: hypothetical protein HY741_20485 [Chloroflexi bacterium]|nr:hypothetical protein [Chloroflexota bacterium]
MNRARNFPLYALLLAPAILFLLVGLWAGLERMGWALPPLKQGLEALHGPLMLAGFLGTLVSLERAVALRVRWFYFAPLLSALGTLLLWLGAPSTFGIALVILGSAGLGVMMLVIVRKQPAPFTSILALGAWMWLIGNGLWLAGFGSAHVVLWWSGFLILTIVGERLELSRLLRVSRNVEAALWIVIGAFSVGVALDALEYAFLPAETFGLGSRLAGLGMLALAVWLLRYDIARRNVRLTGLPRFIAVCLLAGYVWLGVGGVLRLGEPSVAVGMYYDAMLHTVFVGFIFGMIFAHAPIILPALIQRPVPYRATLYAPWALLHTGLIVRCTGDFLGDFTLRQWGGLLNALAMVFFFVTILALTLSAARARDAQATRADRTIH